ncbi:hypothetical protein D3C86_1394720 [compost metagenome]
MQRFDEAFPRLACQVAVPWPHRAARQDGAPGFDVGCEIGNLQTVGHHRQRKVAFGGGPHRLHDRRGAVEDDAVAGTQPLRRLTADRNLFRVLKRRIDRHLPFEGRTHRLQQMRTAVGALEIAFFHQMLEITPHGRLRSADRIRELLNARRAIDAQVLQNERPSFGGNHINTLARRLHAITRFSARKNAPILSNVRQALPNRVSAIHRNDCARHGAGGVRRQKQDRRGDLIGPCDTFHRRHFHPDRHQRFV